MANSPELIGQRYGRLKVIERAGTDSSGHSKWLCQCDCGKTKIARGGHLKSGYIQSCGCIKKEILKKRSTKHGLESTRLYRIWKGMIIRCYNPKSNRYSRYGARGITVCNEWKDNLPAFYEWAMENGYQEDLTIDRIDNDGPYSPDNCRWATMKEQLNHTSRNHLVTINGVTKTIAQWAEENNLKTSAIYGRISRGWPIEKAVTEPTKRKEVM